MSALIRDTPRYASFDRLATGSGAVSGVRGVGAERSTLEASWGMSALCITMDGMVSGESATDVPSALTLLSGTLAWD